MAANEAMVELWNTRSGQTWVKFQDQLDRQIVELGLATMDALALKTGERVLDIGCGCGQTSVQLAERVGAAGSVVGVDVSQPMLEVAKARPVPAGAGSASFREADAQTADLGQGVFDAAFSRFGVMFFDDPVAAFANIRSAMKPGGRLAFLCWRTPPENPLMTAPMKAAGHLLPPSPPADPLAPGPFAFASADRVRAILGDAGWTDATATPLDKLSGAQPFEDALELAASIGPLRMALYEHPGLREAVMQVLPGALAPYLKDGVVRIPTATWIVTARV